MKQMKKVLIVVVALAALALGGAALAGAASGGDDSGDDGGALTGSTLDRASKAALAATGGGEVNQTERDNENGATYEVEVTKPGGGQVDVRLDDQFKVIVVEGDHEDQGDGDGEEND
jgi:uncharacterized membrane protein YkoI